MGIIVPNPFPLRNCPMLDVWRLRAGQEYIIFIDETFNRFFELNAYGYFCYGAVGVPLAEYDALKSEVRPIFEQYRELLVPELREFKHAEFKRIPFQERWTLATRLRDALRKNGCFVSGFYTPAKFFLLERLRTDLLDEADAVPLDFAARLPSIAERIREQWTGPGMSDIITTLINLPVSGLLNFAAGIDVRVRMVYDPREPREDSAVVDAMQKIVDKALPIIAPEAVGRYLGMTTQADSESEIGLQLADLVAGETRSFLEANPDLQRYGASPKLITQTSDEPFQTFMEFKRRNWKNGVITYMPAALAKRFRNKDPKERSVFAALSDVLASCMISCYSSWGTPRHLMFHDAIIVDQLD